jgi:hypothetical protein
MEDSHHAQRPANPRLWKLLMGIVFSSTPKTV